MTWPMSVKIGRNERVALWTPDRICEVVGFRFDKPTVVLEVRHCQLVRALSSREMPSPPLDGVEALFNVAKLELTLHDPVKFKPGEILQIRILGVTGGVTVELLLAEGE